ncbi:MAG: hypothetical protein ACLVDZ_10475 [Ruminococcus sp.]
MSKMLGVPIDILTVECLLDNLSRSSIYKSVQNERVAGIADTVQRGLGMLPQQAICED